ncbi:hypothetical protein H0N95_01120 [Candidatus Micrarchaeota archaeon]|nr:hypothetical protein [Candidatus Micrarchaeota archaeon]
MRPWDVEKAAKELREEQDAQRKKRKAQLNKFKWMPGTVGKKVRDKLISTHVKPTMYSESEMRALMNAQDRLSTTREFETIEGKINKIGNQRKLNAMRMNILDLVASNFPQSQEARVRGKAGKLLKNAFLKRIEEGKPISEILKEDGNELASKITEIISKQKR